jgi:[ribosomal protein S5]-alanine N-acetyltransferase
MANFVEVVLRNITVADAPSILAIRSHTIVNKFIKRKPCTTIAEAEEWINARLQDRQNGVGLMWVIASKEDNNFMGTICLWNFKPGDTIAEIGFDLFPEFYGKGVMDMAIQQVVELSKKQFNTIEAFTHQDNIFSRNLLERNHFILLPDRKDEDVESNVVYAFTHF